MHIPPQWSLRAYTATIGKEIGKEIGTKIGEMDSREQKWKDAAYLPITCRLGLSVHFGSVCWFGSDFCAP